MKRYDWKEVKVWVTPEEPQKEEIGTFDLWCRNEFDNDDSRWVISVYTFLWRSIASYATKRIAEEKLGITISENLQ